MKGEPGQGGNPAAKNSRVGQQWDSADECLMLTSPTKKVKLKLFAWARLYDNNVLKIKGWIQMILHFFRDENEEKHCFHTFYQDYRMHSVEIS